MEVCRPYSLRCQSMFAPCAMTKYVLVCIPFDFRNLSRLVASYVDTHESPLLFNCVSVFGLWRELRLNKSPS